MTSKVRKLELGCVGFGVLAAVSLAGCGGSLPPSNVPSATQQSRWILPEAKSEDLLYVAAGSVIHIFSYPGGKLVGTFKGGESLEGMCADRAGDVYIVEDPEIYEYAHGGTTPIRTINAAQGTDWSCAVDPVTGDLAVTNVGWFLQSPYLMIYPNGSGTPVGYAYVTMQFGYDCVYDDKGDLFVQGINPLHYGRYNLLNELPKNGTSLVSIALSSKIANLNGPTGIAWDGKYVVIGDQARNAYRFKIQRRSGTEAGQITFNGPSLVQQFWLERKQLIVSDIKSGDVSFFNYPAGGDAIKTIPAGASGAVVSLAPKR